ncbi:MAG: macro domain-containing protein, partial [Candidatus Binatia bacterium]
MVQVVAGNLWDAQADAHVNAVNTQGVMGEGIALQFKTKWPEMYLAYRSACEAGEIEPGRMHVFALGEACQPRFIINFPTKRDWRLPSRLGDIESRLNSLVQEIRGREIRSIALPALGCG